MAIIHRAYTVDAEAFHACLDHQLVKDGQLREDALLRLAARIVQDATEQTLQTLDSFRFDPEWLDTSDEEVSHITDWYIIALAEALVPVPSLSNRLLVSHNVLKQFLPWSAGRTRTSA
jgi:hypothetical protein